MKYKGKQGNEHIFDGGQDKYDALESLEKAIYKECMNDYKGSDHCKSELKRLYDASIENMYFALSGKDELTMYISIDDDSCSIEAHKHMRLRDFLVKEAKEQSSKIMANTANQLRDIANEIEALIKDEL